MIYLLFLFIPASSPHALFFLDEMLFLMKMIFAQDKYILLSPPRRHRNFFCSTKIIFVIGDALTKKTMTFCLKEWSPFSRGDGVGKGVGWYLPLGTPPPHPASKGV